MVLQAITCTGTDNKINSKIYQYQTNAKKKHWQKTVQRAVNIKRIKVTVSHEIWTIFPWWAAEILKLAPAIWQNITWNCRPYSMPIWTITYMQNAHCTGYKIHVGKQSTYDSKSLCWNFLHTLICIWLSFHPYIIFHTITLSIQHPIITSFSLGASAKYKHTVY